ncbi:MAG: hemerythrin domain-containing protein [Terriglobales bacterium]|jgi:regulator of cell morphogenesis and NO signaling
MNSSDVLKAAKGELPTSLEQVEKSAGSNSSADCADGSLSSLMAHIVEKHHAYCRQQLDRMEQLLQTAVRTDGERHPELRQIQSLLAKLGRDLMQHLLKEEQTLFPMIARMEDAHLRKAALPRLPFGTIAHPIRMMVLEHDVGGKELEKIRELSSGYTVPPDGSESYRVLYQELKEFEEDMQRHVYLEDQQLFPRAVSLEQAKIGNSGS